ncbi:toll/interleukin-1 receptor domain-containing protein [Chlorobium phaeobacteroides]|uniref:TPR repeat-containing protein n=1 Tax=Chlorobium phaeobacteroides (strain DSM 266 / SMG 266 / 2430) TaxID=290317 RepID=A1BCV0_CHLPD|nr:toll/interleukin-1 receptor domain-containing protein [Chlorobium phaeobacteroides]ABL64227.1 TPR repeat-containing protein [Chlorobium phaeobacteroides DSM 266]
MTTTRLRRQYQYFAFISYSHTDAKVAEWLHRKLESYRLPNAVLRKSDGQLPRHVRPIFRDIADLSSGSLARTLREEIGQSQFLIVICSPDSAKSEWVEMEVSHFLTLRGHEFVIPVIIKGTPYAKDAVDECLPLSLLRTEVDLLGISFAGQSKEQVLLKTVSALLDIKYDSLYDRHRRRQRRQRMFAATVVTVMFVVVLTASLFSFIQWNRAEQRRAEAEQLLNYLLLDLHPKLKQFGRLDILESVAEKSREYIDYISTDVRDPIDAIQAISLRRNMAEVYQSVGKLENAEALHLKNISVLKKLEQIDPKMEIIHLLKGEEHQALASIRKTEGRFQDALHESLTAFSVFKSFVSVKSDARWRSAKASSEQRLSDAYYDLGMGKQAAWHINSAVSDFRRILHEHSAGDNSYKADLAYALVSKSRVEVKWGTTSRAYSVFVEASELFRQHLEEHPEDREVRASFANVVSDLAAMLKDMGRLEDALIYWDLAIDAERELVTFEPLNVRWHADLSETMMNKANALGRLGRTGEGFLLYEEVSRHQRKLIALQPKVARWRATYAWCRHNMAIEYARLGKNKGAIDLWNDAIATIEQLRKDGRAKREWLLDLCNMLDQRATITAENGNFEKAEQDIKASQAIRASLISDSNSSPDELSQMGLNQARKALLDYYRKDYSHAMVSIKAAEGYLRRAVKLDEANCEWRAHLAGTLRNSSVIHRAAGFPDKAKRAIDECIVILEKLRIRQPSDKKIRVDLSQAYNNQGNLYNDFGSIKSSVSAWEKSLTLDSDPAQREFLATRLGTLAYQYILLQDPGKSEMSARKALEVDAAPWIQINLGHALFLQDMREAAKAQYLNAMRKDGKILASISADFVDMENHGIHVRNAIQMLDELRGAALETNNEKQ